MTRLLGALWNGSLRLLGGSAGWTLRRLLKRGWVHFPFVSEALAFLPFSAGYKLRASIYRALLPRFGDDVVLHVGVVIQDSRTSFGTDVWVSHSAYVDYAEIGDSVLIGPHACLLSGDRHHFSDRIDIPIKSQGNPDKTPIRIGSGAWIGAHAVVMASVGRDAIVGAGSVVTKDVPPFAVVVGNPGRVLRFRDRDAIAGSSRASAQGGG
jgi:acetyltransferase-like isoleucine patch superfamily enzyme